MLQRILSDLRDLWTLITKGQPEVDPLLPWRMMADLAKFQPAPVDIDRWEAEQYARNPLAVWFDPDRYAGTKYDWPKRHEAAQEGVWGSYGCYQHVGGIEGAVHFGNPASFGWYLSKGQGLMNTNSYGNKSSSSLANILGL